MTFKVTSSLYKILLIIFVISSIIECRRYDIEEECKRIYKEDLATVLQRFRRSPEYLRILNKKVGELSYSIAGILLEVYAYHSNKTRLGLGVAKALNIELVEEPTTVDCAKGKRYKSRREGEDEISPQVQGLDYYVQTRGNSLTPAESNACKNYGYEVSGMIIHDLIKGFGGGDDDAMSTRQMMIEDEKGNRFTATTPHCAVHTVSPLTTSTFLPPAARIGADLETKFLYKPNQDPVNQNPMDIVEEDRRRDFSVY